MTGRNSLITLAFLTSLLTGAAQAGWQDKLSSSASDLFNASSGQQATHGDSGLNMASLSSLLAGGDSSLSSKNINNATGVLQYCAKNNVVDDNVSSVTEQLKSKLGISDTKNQQTSYLQGVAGLLNTGNKTIDLKTLGDTPLGKKLKTKACGVVLDQGKKFLGL